MNTNNMPPESDRAISKSPVQQEQSGEELLATLRAKHAPRFRAWEDCTKLTEDDFRLVVT